MNRDIAQLAVLDVVGHGLETVRIANQAVATYRNARRAGKDLAAMLVEMDRTIAEEVGEHRFVTGHLATIGLEDGALQMLNAGHPAPMLFRDGLDMQTYRARRAIPSGWERCPSSAATSNCSPATC